MKPFLCTLLLLLTFSPRAQAPTAVPLKEEPHHHLVLENDYVRVFRVSVPAHAATLLHQHDVPYLYISLGPADVVNAVQGRPEARIVMADGQLGYSPGHFAHIARTDAGSTFDNVTIELLKPQGEPRNLCAQVAPGTALVGCYEDSGSGSEGGGFTIEPQFETQEMSLDILRVGPETTTLKIAVYAESLLVAPYESEVQVDVQGKPTLILHGGEVTWIGTGSRGFISNPSKKPVGCFRLSFRTSSGSARH
jgi:hypothetical protein